MKTLLSENFEETCMAHYMIIWCHEHVKLPVNVYSYVYNLLGIETMHGTSVKSKSESFVWTEHLAEMYMYRLFAMVKILFQVEEVQKLISSMWW